MSAPLKDHIALVTGASRGIGAATAEAMAQAGAHVVLTARTAADLELAEERIHQAGGTATIAPGGSRSSICARRATRTRASSRERTPARQAATYSPRL